MAFRELTENEVTMLSERQKQLYLEELELYRERCAFVDRIEELENIEYPKIKPKYVYLSKVKANKAIAIGNIKDSKIVIDKVFSPNTINGKENVGQLENMIHQLDEEYKISESENIVIAKTLDDKYNAPNNENVELPTVVIENPDSETDYNFTEVKISDSYQLVTEADIYVNEIKYEKVNVENNISINTSHPEIKFNLEEVGDVNIDLIIKDDYISPEVFEFSEANMKVENTKVYMPQEEKIDIELPEEVKLTDIESKVLDTPIINIEVDNDNKIELTKTTNVDMPNMVEVSIEAAQVSLDEPIVAKAAVNKEFIFEDKKIENNIDTVVSVASEVEFNVPELIVNENKILIDTPIVAKATVNKEFIFEDKKIENNIDTVVSVASEVEFNVPELIVNENKILIDTPFCLEEGATDRIMQIISSMGDTYEK